MRCSLVLILLAFCLGCGDSGLKDIGRLPLTGAVTLDGKPVVNGSIRFEPIGGKEISSGAPIRSGNYTIDRDNGLPAGKYKVYINASEAVAPPADFAKLSGEAQMNAAAAAPAKELIPSKYNSETTLEIEIENGKLRKFDFALTSS